MIVPREHPPGRAHGYISCVSERPCGREGLVGYPHSNQGPTSAETNVSTTGFHTEGGGGTLGTPLEFENYDVMITSTATIGYTTVTKYSISIDLIY